MDGETGVGRRAERCSRPFDKAPVEPQGSAQRSSHPFGNAPARPQGPVGSSRAQ